MAVTISGSGQIIKQVIQTFLPTTFSTTSTSFTNVTGLSVSITPTNANNKILVITNLFGGNSAATGSTLFALTRNGTSVGGGTSSGSIVSAIGNGSIPFTSAALNSSIYYLDSPATTSAVTYQIQIKAQSGLTATLGYGAGESNSDIYGRYPSIITVMEVAYA